MNTDSGEQSIGDPGLPYHRNRPQLLLDSAEMLLAANAGFRDELLSMDYDVIASKPGTLTDSYHSYQSNQSAVFDQGAQQFYTCDSIDRHLLAEEVLSTQEAALQMHKTEYLSPKSSVMSDVASTAVPRDLGCSPTSHAFGSYNNPGA